jgi:hypothetical protein
MNNVYKIIHLFPPNLACFAPWRESSPLLEKVLPHVMSNDKRHYTSSVELGPPKQDLRWPLTAKDDIDSEEEKLELFTRETQVNPRLLSGYFPSQGTARLLRLTILYSPCSSNSFGLKESNVNPVPQTYVRGFRALPFGDVRNIHPVPTALDSDPIVSSWQSWNGVHPPHLRTEPSVLRVNGGTIVLWSSNATTRAFSAPKVCWKSPPRSTTPHCPIKPAALRKASCKAILASAGSCAFH